MHPLAVHPEITVVHNAGCHYCDDAHSALAEIATQQQIHVRYMDADSPEGTQLLAHHRAPMLPLVLVDGQFFSYGRLPRRKLVALLQNKAKAGAR